MNRIRRNVVVPLGMSLGIFFVITYVPCVLFGLVVPVEPMQQLLPMLLPGFSWITWPTLLLGLAWAFAYGWYVTLVFTPDHTFFIARDENRGSA